MGPVTALRATGLLATDIVDSTAISERLGDEAASALWAEHAGVGRALIERHRGREIDCTDGFFVIFDDIGDAAAFALDYHRALAVLGLRARVGLHHAEVALRHTPAESVARGAKPLEVEGLAKPLAARVMSLARGGQTLLTAEARRALGAPPPGCELAGLGHYRAKGLAEPVQLFGLAPPGGSHEPPADSDKVYRVVRDADGAGALWKPLREVPHNLAPERDAFVGRAAELRRLAGQLEDGARLLTVLGVGGTGKTRLARRYARAWLGEWPGGVYFCDLSEARGLDGIHFAVASALSLQLVRGDPGAQLGHAIAARGRCLLVLDNFEQVVAQAPVTVGAWLDRAAQAAFLVTSRERLHLAGEAVFALEPLPVDSEAVELFEVRARAQRSALALDDTQRAAVRQIARLLDGLPLALELAAARVRSMSPVQVLQRLSQRFEVLAGARGAAARQATLRAAIDWSWDLLGPAEQRALAQCSVFEGGFTLEAAEAVIDTGGLDGAPPAMDLVQSLVDKSLLRMWTPTAARRLDIAEPMFGMYLTIHEYVADRLERLPGGQRAPAEQRHGRHFARHGSDEALESLVRHGGAAHRQALALELDNLVAACRRAVARHDAAVAVPAFRAAWEVMVLTGPVGAGAALGQAVLAMDGLDEAAWVDAALSCADALFRAGRLADCEALMHTVLDRARRLGDARREGVALARTASVLRDKGRLAEARPMFEAAALRSREAGHRAGEASVLHHLGNTLDMLGEPVASRAAHEAALALHREMGNLHGVGHVHSSLGILERHTGRLHEALQQYGAALALFREVGDRRSEGNTIGNMANVFEDLGRDAEQLQCLQQALAINRETGSRVFEGIVLGNLGLMHLRHDRLDEAQEALTQALAIQRETDSRLFQGVILDNLARLAQRRGRADEARRLFAEALARHRETDNRLYVGMSSQGLGALLLDAGELPAALQALREGEAQLRAIDNPTELLLLLCVLGRALQTGGDGPGARAALAEAEGLLQRVQAGPDSMAGREVQALRTRLG